MKRVFLGAILLCLIHSDAFAQFQIHPDSSFYTFLDSFFFYHQDDSMEGGVYNRVNRDMMTWGPRLAPTGKMSVATGAIIEYSRTYNQNSGGGGLPIPPSASTTITFPSTHPFDPSWNELGPVAPVIGGNSGKGMGQIHRVAFDPSYGITPPSGVLNQRVYAGSHYGGLFVSDDAGANWENYHTDRELPMTSIGGVAASRGRVFVCTGNGDHGYSNFGYNAFYDPLRGSINNADPIHTQGVYYLNIGTSQWIPINGTTTMIDGVTVLPDLLEAFKLGGTMRDIIVHPINDQILLIATSQGVFRTTNRGANWQQVLVGPSLGGGNYTHDPNWIGLEYHPTNPDTVYASGSKDIFMSIDGGATWNSIANNLLDLNLSFVPGRINLAVTPAAPNDLYAYAVGNVGHVYLYDGTNSNWVLQNTGSISSAEAQYTPIAVSPTNPQEVYVGAVNIFHSINVSSSGNASFSSQGGDYHADIHALEFSPNAGAELFTGTHGGVSRKIGSGVWESRYNGLGVATIWAFDDWEGNDSVIVTANQDVGVNHTIDYANTWSSVYALGDGYGARVDDHSGKAYLKYNNYRDIHHVTPTFQKIPPIDGGSAFTVIYPKDFSYLPSDDARIPNVFPMVNHPKNEIPYLGFSELYIRTNCTLPDSLVNYVSITDTLVYSGNKAWNASGTAFFPIPQGGSICFNDGTFIGTDTFYYSPPFLGIYVYKIDTLCEVTSLQQAPGNFWELKSDLKLNQPSRYNRRIMELAFSEDTLTNYTYLATLGDNGNGWRRSDFYFNDADNFGCDTCFVLKTNNLPVDSLTFPLSADPNPITGIAVDPMDGNRIWASFSGFNRKIKVWYSEDAGDTWTTYDDPQSSLAKLNVPVNHIVYQRGTRDRIYIATDVGVYVRENNPDGTMGEWMRYGDVFPNVRTVELKINYCTGKLRVATFGRGAWEADLLPTEDDIAFHSFRVVTGTEVWDEDKNMSRGVKVKRGATLRLDSMTLNMPKGGIIVIEQGGQLISESSTITNKCGETWQGIEIWGTSSKRQFPFNGIDQGMIVLNNSTVEYAKEALSPWEVGNFPNASGTIGGTGGIIVARNSKFLNNWRTAGFMKYEAPPLLFTGSPREASSFTECLFSVDNDFRPFDMDTVPAFLGHVSIWATGGTEFRGCTFEDKRSNKAGDQATGGCFGIGTLAASPHIIGQPIGGTFPASGFIRNTFEGIERAVEIGSPNNTNFTSIVSRSTFIDNEQSVTIRNQNGVFVVRDSFKIGGFNTPANTPAAVEEFGLGIITATDYTVEQNNFEGMNSIDPLVGSWIEDTGGNPNRIRRNTYTDLTGANLAHGDNGTDSISPFGGIQYWCNRNQVNDFDFIVFPNANSTGADASIGDNQGDLGQPCRNTLSASINPFPSQSQFFNFSFTQGSLNAPVTYYYTNDPLAPNEEPDPLILFNVDDQSVPFGNANFCQDNFAALTPPQVVNKNGNLITLNNLKKKHYKAVNKYEKLKAKYKKLIDKGNTDSLKTVINTTQAQNKNVLKDSLMSISPFLSKEVVLTVADCGLFNRNKLMKIIKENPDVIQQHDFISLLTTCNTPLTVADIADIEASPNVTLKPNKRTFRRKKLEGKISRKYVQMFFWANQVIHVYANDTLGPHNDSLEVWIKNKPSISAQYELVEHYWRQERYQDALTLIQNIPSGFMLSQRELDNHQSYEQLKKLLWAVYQKERTEANMDRQEVNILNEIAAKKTGFASVQAANILQFFYGISYIYYPTIPNINTPQTRRTTLPTDELSILDVPRIWGYPNPAINWADIKYQLPEGMKEGVLRVIATTGQTIETIQVKGNSGIINLNTADWSSGIYFAVFVSNDSKSNVYKLVVRK